VALGATCAICCVVGENRTLGVAVGLGVRVQIGVLVGPGVVGRRVATKVVLMAVGVLATAGGLPCWAQPPTLIDTAVKAARQLRIRTHFIEESPCVYCVVFSRTCRVFQNKICATRNTHYSCWLRFHQHRPRAALHRLVALVDHLDVHQH
jgi:hypothetical protein